MHQLPIRKDLICDPVFNDPMAETWQAFKLAYLGGLVLLTGLLALVPALNLVSAALGLMPMPLAWLTASALLTRAADVMDLEEKLTAVAFVGLAPGYLWLLAHATFWM